MYNLCDWRFPWIAGKDKKTGKFEAEFFQDDISTSNDADGFMRRNYKNYMRRRHNVCYL